MSLTKMLRIMLAATAFAVVVFSGSAERLHAQQNEADNVIRFFQAKISQDPDDFFNYDRLGVAYIQKARETGDIAYYDLAEKALQKSLALESTHPEAASATKHLATVYFAEHRFADTLAITQQALKLNTRDVTPYALLGDARSEMGEYQQAWDAFDHLQNPNDGQSATRGVQYLVQSRESVKAFLTGAPTSAIEHMRRAAEISTRARMARESIAWSQFTLGENYFQVGDYENAKGTYQDALKAFPGYHRALAGSAKVAAAQGRFVDAIEWYKKAIAVIPLPIYAAALGDVYAKTGNAAEAKKQYDLVEYIGRLNTFNQRVYNRELAIFYADHDIHLPEALALARKEIKVRHDIYTCDALAWVLYKNSQPEQAAAAMKEALRLDTKDALLLFHAGMIYEHLNEPGKAQDFLRRALALNPRFHVFFADVAQSTLQRLSRGAMTAQAARTSDAKP